MLRFIAWRLVQFPVMLAAVYLITFLLAWVAPGSPFERADRKLDPQVLKAVQQRLHAESAWQFLLWYPRNLLTTGDFGQSLNYEEWSVNDILKSALPVSVSIGLFGVCFAVFADPVEHGGRRRVSEHKLLGPLVACACWQLINKNQSKATVVVDSGYSASKRSPTVQKRTE